MFKQYGRRKMVEFEFRPWRKVIIHELMEFPLEHFIFQSSQGIQPGGTGRPIMWSNGLVFTTFLLQPTEDVVKEQLQGIVHWAFLHFGRMDKYQREVKGNNRIRIPVIDVSNHSIFGPMSNWIKTK